MKDVIGEINKNAGKQLVTYGRDILDQEVEFIPTGILPLDAAIGGGFPKGRIVEIHGLESSSKTSLSLGIIANYQKKGLRCAFADVEFALNLDHARKIGVNTDELMIIKGDFGEEIMETIEKVVRENLADVIVIDSISALVTKAEAEAEVNKPLIGTQAKLVSNALKKIIGPLNKNGTILIAINQLRVNIMGGQYNPYIITGGMSLRFYSSVMLEMKRDKALMQGENLIGYSLIITVKKNKVGPPAQKCSIKFIFDSGFSAEADVIDAGLKLEVLTKQGNTIYFGELKLGVGENKARQYLIENPEVLEEIMDKLN